MFIMTCLHLKWCLFLGITLDITWGALYSNDMFINGLQYTFIYDDSVKMIHITEAIVALANIVVEDSACAKGDDACTLSLLAEHLLSTEEELDPTMQLTYPTDFPDFFRDIDTVLLNLGSNIDPVIPELFVPLDRKTHTTHTSTNDHGRASSSLHEMVWCGDSIRTLAFEPVPGVLRKISAKPWLHMVAAAVAAHSGVKPMYVYNIDSVSSSLHESNYDFVTDESSEDGQMVSHACILPKHFHLD